MKKTIPVAVAIIIVAVSIGVYFSMDLVSNDDSVIIKDTTKTEAKSYEINLSDGINFKTP